MIDRNTPPDVLTLRRMVLDRGYRWFESLARPHNLNIVGVRVPDARWDRFDDWLTVAWAKPSSTPNAIVWDSFTAKITTLPGERYMVQKLLNPLGCAILKGGQYRGTYAIDKHRGAYFALCQRLGKVGVYRDRNRDRKWDLDPATVTRGNYGINIHHASTAAPSTRIGAYSAGCQVFPDNDDFVRFMQVCHKAKANWGNSFTYTLIDLMAESRG